MKTIRDWLGKWDWQLIGFVVFAVVLIGIAWGWHTAAGSLGIATLALCWKYVFWSYR